MNSRSLEAELVMQAARTTVTSPDRVRSLAAEDVAWGRVAELARRNGVVPLVAETLSNYCDDLVDEETLRTLTSEQQRIAKQNLQLTGELCDIVSELSERGINALPYRGAVLAADVYEDIARRQFGDIDLLVRRADIPRIKQYLEERGYVTQYERPDTERLSENQERAYTKYRRDYAFYRAETDTLVELHWRVLDRIFPTKIELETVWDRRVVRRIGGAEVPVLSAEDRLLMLCVHGSRHHWERLGWVCDIAELLQRQPIDWDVTLRRAREQNAERMFLLGPHLARTLYGTELPAAIRTRIDRQPGFDALTAKVEKQLCSDERLSQPELKSFQRKSLGRHRDKLRLSLGWLFVPTRSEIELFDFPRVLFFLYFVVRPLRLCVLQLNRIPSRGRIGMSAPDDS